MNKKTLVGILFAFVLLVLLAPWFVFKDLLFPFITSKAFFLRIVIELALPLYAFLIIAYPNLRPDLRKNRLNQFMILFWVVSLISAFAGVNAWRSMWGNFERMGGVYYLAHLTLLYFYVVLLGQQNPKFVRWFLQTIVGMASLFSLYGVMVWVTGNHFILNDPSYPRISATFGNPIFLGSFLILPMFLTMMFALQAEKRAWAAWYWVLAALQLWGIFLSATRGALVGLVAGLFCSAVLYLIFAKNRHARIYGGSIMGAGILALVLLYAFHSKLPTTWEIGRIFNLNDTNAQARVIQWKTALKGVKDHPLFGVGSENYYVISNKYYNPQIYNYDRSWFDKPHNYLLEVLTTNGVVGFAVYTSILLLVLYALYKGFRAEFFGTAEWALLSGGFIAYTIQNLFVFDTIPAGLMFFSFVAFAAYLWHETDQPANAKQAQPKRDTGSIGLASAAAGLLAVAAVYAVFVTNVSQGSIGKNINYGYAYTNVDPVKAEQYFENATGAPLNFFKQETGSRYADYASSIFNYIGQGSVNQAFVDKAMQNAIDYNESVMDQIGNDPTTLQKLASMYIIKAIVDKQQTINPRAEELLAKCMELAPGRPEPIMAMARLRIYQNNTAAAANLLTDLVKSIPNNQDAKLQLAMIENYTGKKDEAAKLAQSVIDSGYASMRASDIDWLARYYVEQKDYPKADAVYVYMTKLEPNNVQIYFQIAQYYAASGRIEQALQLAKGIRDADKAEQPQIDAFIKQISK